jgi:[ribosomal protein S5]-alanine N-acetyltransferase
VIRLVRATVELLDAAIVSDRALTRMLGHAVVPGWATFTGALPRVRDALAGEPSESPWGPRLFVTGEPPELVGWGGFKGPPRDGVVELGYEIADSRRERGLATAAVRAMLSEAFADPGVVAVIAHTLPERNASTRVLEKTGFRFEAVVRQGGATVWRFTRIRERPTTPAPRWR